MHSSEIDEKNWPKLIEKRRAGFWNVPLLSAWRRLNARELEYRGLDHYIGELAELTRSEHPAMKEAISIVLSSRDPDTRGRVAYFIATLLPSNNEPDLAMSWIAVAACLRVVPAMTTIAAVLSKKSRSSDNSPFSPRDRSRMRRLAVHWAEDNTEYFILLGQTAALRLTRQLTVQIASDLKNASADKASAHSGEPALQVMTAIGDSRGRDAIDIANRYKAITTHLPLNGGGVDPDTLYRCLMLEYPWLEPVIERIAIDLRLGRLAGLGHAKIRPILLIGPPGIGKSRFMSSLARYLGTGSTSISVAGASDNRMLCGTARGWQSAQPCLPIISILQHGCANPLIMVDEIEKSATHGKGMSVVDALLPLLEPVTAQRHYDECLLGHADLSQVNWILAGNSTINLPEPLLSRVTLVHAKAPGPEHFDIILGGVLRDIERDFSAPPGRFSDIDEIVIDALREAVSVRPSIRRLKAAAMSIIGQRAVAKLVC
jgi:hypothetical protein